MVDITQIDHVTEGLSLLPGVWDNSPIFRGVLTSWLTPINDTEQCALDVRDGFNLLTAVGPQLDIIGAYFDEKRGGRTDLEYRNAILAVISATNGSGTPDQLINLFSTYSGTTNVKLFEHYPLSVVLYSQEGDIANPDVSEDMEKAAPAGVEYGALMYDPDSFGWIGNDTALEEANLITALGDQIVDDIPNNITIIANFEQIDDGSGRSSFIDESVDGTSIGYGENYGEAYGGLIIDQSQFVDAVVKDNSFSSTPNGTGNFVPWAIDNDINDAFDPTSGTANKVDPIKQLKSYGLKPKEPMARQFFNWMMASIDAWLSYISDRTVVGTIRISQLPLKFVNIDTVVNNQLYRITIGGEQADFTSDSDATVDEITAGLAIALDGLPTPTNGIDNGDGTVTIERDALYTVTTNVNANMTIVEDFPFRFGGSWNFNGTQTLATITTYVFERTS